MLLPSYQKQNKTPNTEQHEFMGTARKKKNKTAKTVLVHFRYHYCLWTVVLEKTLESPLDCKEIQPVHSEGDQS